MRSASSNKMPIRHSPAVVEQRRHKRAQHSQRVAHTATSDGNSTVRSSSIQEELRTTNQTNCLQRIRILHRRAKAAKQSHREAFYILIAVAYRLAIWLETNDDVRDKFWADPFWKRRRADKRSSSLSLALMYAYGSWDGAQAERARDHARALRILWLEKTPAAAVYEYLLHEGGIAALKQQAKKKRATHANRHCTSQSTDRKNIGDDKRFASSRERETSPRQHTSGTLKLIAASEQRRLIDKLGERESIWILVRPDESGAVVVEKVGVRERRHDTA